MNVIFPDSFARLKAYCEKEEFKGWDPYDGLSSKLFQSMPLINKNRFFRLAWIQTFKKLPFNLRKITLVSKEYNSKGLALFLTGYCNLYKKTGNKDDLEKIQFLAEKLISLRNNNYSGSCWGYYFDWQARAFFQPANTPTVVATSFAADALFNAFEITDDKSYLDIGLSSCKFVLNDLNRTYDASGDFSFSYSPLDNSQVFNASLLGARLLSRAHFFTADAGLKEEARKAVRYACNHQQADGSWKYGTLPFHGWVDSFHTGFNLECIYEYGKYSGDKSFTDHLTKGLDYYLNTFFCEDGRSKYYNNQIYPIDIHAPAQLIVTLSKLGHMSKNQALAENVLQWTIKNMQHAQGYFFYQKKKRTTSKIPYMRWAQAWMFYSMTYYFIFACNSNDLEKHTTNEKPDTFTGHPS